VRLVLALGERDADSLDAYHGPPEWQADARAAYATLPEIRASAAALAAQLETPNANEDEVRRQFLIRQLGAVVARIDVVRGARLPFDEEARLLFGLDVPAVEHGPAAAAVREAIDRLLPGPGDLAARYAAYDRKLLIAPDRLPAVLARAIEGCRTATSGHLALPPSERVDVDYIRELSWSAFTRYAGGFTSRIQVNTGLPLTVDRALDLACHESYPGHHTIASLLEARFGGRVEFLVQPLFSLSRCSMRPLRRSRRSWRFPNRREPPSSATRCSRWRASIPPKPPVTCASAVSSTRSTASRPTSRADTSTAASTSRAPPPRSSAMPSCRLPMRR